MERTDLINQLSEHAKAQGLELVVSEVGRDVRVEIGDRRAVVPRHSEINETTVGEIFEQMGAKR